MSTNGAAIDRLRDGCHGLPALDARLESWQRGLLARPAALEAAIAEHGSPVNLHHLAPMGRNGLDLVLGARRAGVGLTIHVARKANRTLAVVDEARRLGHGVDVASEAELAETLARGVPAHRVIVTAAVKPAALLRSCVEERVPVSVDNADELELLDALAHRAGAGAGGAAPVPVLLRLAVDGPRESRFGLPAPALRELVRARVPPGGALEVRGIHFHLDGYAAADRSEGIRQSLALVGALRALGHRPALIDIGGGVPMSYLEHHAQWERFWRAHRAALLGRGRPVTLGAHPLGLAVAGGRVVGTPSVYPAHQRPVGGAWLEEVLRAPAGRPGGGTLARSLAAADVALHAEPGRAMLDGCGMTVARVEFRKRRRDGTWLIGLAMNRTQLRSAADDFLVDPLLVRAPGRPARGGAVDGYLVGAYCIEREFITWRRLRFPHGVEVGDMLAFPNTAGYLMHILESASHRIPLAANLVADPAGALTLDPGEPRS